MIIEITKKYPQTPFAVKTEKIKNDPGTWDSTKVSIFRGETLIGEYLRNYSNYGSNTFYPFKMNDAWYALYSADYTATRVMKLHIDHIEDWCGEVPAGFGFCPVEFYVPHYIHTKHKYQDSTYDSFVVDCDTTAENFDEEAKSLDIVNVGYCNFGFLSGCIWGDDSSWKLRHIDLSKVPDKILSITEKFGYWELPNHLTLKECIDMVGWEPDHDWVKLCRSESVNVTTNERG